MPWGRDFPAAVDAPGTTGDRPQVLLVLHGRVDTALKLQRAVPLPSPPRAFLLPLPHPTAPALPQELKCAPRSPDTQPLPTLPRHRPMLQREAKCSSCNTCGQCCIGGRGGGDFFLTPEA